MMNDSLDDVADSTDWLSTPLSGLAAVEAALRCQVCKDFYKTPVLTSCNHTFCSVCIRRALSNDGKCPLCRASEQEMKLRSNWSMEETVDAFVKTRQDVLNFATKPAANKSTVADSPKRKRDEIDDQEQDEIATSSQRSSKRLRSSTRLSKSRGTEATADMARQEAVIQQDVHDNDDDDGGNYEPGTSFSNLARKRAAKPLERLPAIHYPMLKEAQLRKKLSELGIAAGGSRAVLERRHKEWVALWNANCDALRPRRKAELLQDLDAWERTQGARAPTSSRSQHLGAQIRDKDFDGAAWAARHDTSFRDLIASARKNVSASASKKTAQEHGQEIGDSDDESSGDDDGDENAEEEKGQQGNQGPGPGPVPSPDGLVPGEAVAGEGEIPPPWQRMPPFPPTTDTVSPLSYYTGLLHAGPAGPGAVVDLTGDSPEAAATPGGTWQQHQPPPNGVPGSINLPPLDVSSSSSAEMPHVYRMPR
ncbi:E3 ubiquitin-protein ligase rad18 [Diatrype stigma]|uniref:Postreplication repair E3 ubiquitin-protein ligase RAD18 n=1 Tax=Diatrype stigma TaxID=117547 RepID=A0AAN9UJJ0_9PEZI